jgi:alginate O-acetyltransferase complex protein AlgI
MWTDLSTLSPGWLGLMALVAAVYAVLSRRLRPLWLGTSCLAFLLGTSPQSAIIVVAMGAVCWMAGQAQRHRGATVTAICVTIVAILASFKVAAQSAASSDVGQWVLPLGISYYSFRCIHYLLERYKGSLPPHTLAEFSAYLLFLPTFAAGPIHRFAEFHRDYVAAGSDARSVSAGLERIVYGYVKIVVLGNFLVGAVLVPQAAALGGDSPWAAAYLATIAQGLNAYLQFAGYSDVAIGCALLMGFRVMENFQAPFLAANIAEFWRRWHISLTSWCRDYVYTTIVSVLRRPAVAALVTMLVVGLWHEVSLRYVLWGLWHGVGLAVWQGYRRMVESGAIGGRGAVLPSWMSQSLGVLLTFHYVMLSFVLLADGSLAESMGTLQLLLTGRGP